MPITAPIPSPIPGGAGGVRPGPLLQFPRASVPGAGGVTDFGQDLNFLDDLDPSLGLLGGTDNLGQALIHRLSTPRGGLFYDANYGTDLRAYVNESISAATLARARADVQAECAKDERVLACTASTSFDATTKTLLVQVAVQTAAGPFALVLAVTSVSVALLSATRGF